MRTLAVIPAVAVLGVGFLLMPYVLENGEVKAMLQNPIEAVKDIIEPEATVLIAGDLMYDRSVRAYASERGDEHIFSCMAERLQSYDLVIANLEGPVTEYASVSMGSTVGDPNNTRFTFPVRLPSLLAEHNIRAVSIGNNHIYDFGRDGIEATREKLDAAGIVYAGDPTDPTNTSTIIVENPLVTSLVTFNEFIAEGSDAAFADTLQAISARAQDSFVIVFAHWGDEYVPASERQKEWAHAFVDAGAHLVVGAHPHVVQEREEYKGVPIYYSLGNFIFDQYFQEEVRNGLALEVTLSKNGIESIEERRVQMSRDRRTCFVE
jgi:poly-gamma-glutamate synthesis protein (capsule biosynthesis protein)